MTNLSTIRKRLDGWPPSNGSDVRPCTGILTFHTRAGVLTSTEFAGTPLRGRGSSEFRRRLRARDGQGVLGVEVDSDIIGLRARAGLERPRPATLATWPTNPSSIPTISHSRPWLDEVRPRARESGLPGLDSAVGCR